MLKKIFDESTENSVQKKYNIYSVHNDENHSFDLFGILTVRICAWVYEWQMAARIKTASLSRN